MFGSNKISFSSHREQRESEKNGKEEKDESPPDDFDPANGDARDEGAHRIQIEKAKILREKLRWCYRVVGINHLQKCRNLRHQYLESTRGIGWGKDHRPYEFHGPKQELKVEESEVD